MEKIQVQFQLKGEIDQHSRSEVASLVNGLSSSAVQLNEKRGISYVPEMQRSIRATEEQIIHQLLIQHGSLYSSGKIELTNTELRNNQGKPEPRWQVSFTLLSDIYTCIDIVSDKTIVCYREGDETIHFVPMLANMRLIRK